MEFEKILSKKDLTRDEFFPVWNNFKKLLNEGKIRVATKEDDKWIVNTKVKEFIMLGFKYGIVKEFEDGSIDKDTMGERKLNLEGGYRKVSPTVSIRDGVYIGKGVTFMPPCYTNIGVYLDEGTMVDSIVLVGSCAQIGKNVHLGAGVIIGGVIEPAGAYPVIVEDNVFIGAGCKITEGTIVESGAVLGAGVTITGSTEVYDNVNGNVIFPNENGVIVIPQNAVVIPGTKKINSKIDGAELSKNVPIIIKYR